MLRVSSDSTCTWPNYDEMANEYDDRDEPA